jgi:hypothetical protein
MRSTSIYSSKTGTEGLNLELLLLALLVIGAGILIVPQVLRQRTLDSPLDTVTDFHRGMSALSISTREYEPRVKGQYYVRTESQSDPGPYVRRSNYEEYEEAYDEEFMPYPSNRARIEMETRRQRVMVTLLIIALGTGIMTLIPNIRWIIPIHIAVLVLLAGYLLLVILLPYYERRR